MARTLYIRSGYGASTSVNARYDSGSKTTAFSVVAQGHSVEPKSKDACAEIELSDDEAIRIALDLIRSVNRHSPRSLAAMPWGKYDREVIDILNRAIVESLNA